MDKISVIVPVFNMCEHLNRIIISLLHQTFINTEIILIDKGSTDDSLNICNTWAFLDNRIKVINASKSVLKTAFKACTGDFIYVFDSLNIDDSYMFEMLHEAITNNSADISVYNSNSHVVETKENVDNEFIQKMSIGFCNKLFRYNLFKSLSFRKNLVEEAFMKASKISLIV